jgi:scyllo-inositol 2-dehydrogenase (NADP+)
VALLGYGLAGAVFHAPLVRATAGIGVTAVVTRDPERRAQASRGIPGVTLLDSADQVWQDAGEFDLVVVATPTGSHAQLAQAAVSAGLDVVVDKPLASTTAEAFEVTAAAARAGRLLTVFHNRRWDGDLLTLQTLLANGDLGRVLRFESRFERFRPAPRGAWRESIPAAGGGGILLDLGSHIVDQALFLFGRPRTVYAEVAARRPGAVVDDDAFIALEHEGGITSHLWASAVAAAPGPRLRVLGTAAGYVKEGLDIQEEALRAGGDPGAAGWGKEPEQRWGVLFGGAGRRRIETEPGRWADFYAGVVRAIRDGAAPPVSAQSAVEVMEVLDAARESARTESVTRLDGA